MSSEIEQELAPEANASQTNNLDPAKEIERLTTQNERLLFESKKNKTRMSEVETLQAKLHEIENKKLEEDGNWQERLKSEQGRVAELNSKFEVQQERILKSNVLNAVTKYATDAYDVEELLEKKSYLDMIEVNEETLIPTSESVIKFVDSLKADKAHLFKGKKVAAMADSKPTVDKPLIKNFAQMNEQEKKQAMSDQIALAFKRT